MKNQNQQQDKATPRPWKASDDSINTADGSQIVGRCAGDTDQEARANAALIVKAVNEYAVLCAVAEAAKVAIGYYDKSEQSDCWQINDISVALAALASIRAQQ